MILPLSFVLETEEEVMGLLAIAKKAKSVDGDEMAERLIVMLEKEIAIKESKK